MDEFLDCYSDDIIQLKEARKVMLALQKHEFSTQLCNATFCRIYIILLVGQVEMVLKHWRTRDGIPFEDLFDHNGKITNQQRVDRMVSVFRIHLMPTDPAILFDFLALRYIRNALIHSEWNEQQQAFVEERGFPIDARSFRNQDWIRIAEIDSHLICLLGLCRGITNKVQNNNSEQQDQGQTPS